MSRPDVAYLIEPRFPGGTSSAIASELPVTNAITNLTIHTLSETMFPGRGYNQGLSEALRQLRLDVQEDASEIRADVVIVHNPSFLKFQQNLKPRIICRTLIVVTHENFYRAGNSEQYDVGHCLELIDHASLATRKILAPVSQHNETTVREWLADHRGFSNWQIAPHHWFNICEFETRPPTKQPGDKRGRISRAGLEKFPSQAALDACFPKHADLNLMLGADPLIDAKVDRSHWTMKRFGSMPVEDFYDSIDFMVYFVSDSWQESFGRVLAEAIAAGKVVLTDTRNAAAFGDGVVTCAPKDVDRIISDFVGNPDRYAAQVIKGQACLTNYSAKAFAKTFEATLRTTGDLPCC